MRASPQHGHSSSCSPPLAENECLGSGPPSIIFTQKQLELTHEQHRFEECGATYMQIYFSINIHVWLVLYPQVSHLWIQPTQMRRADCMQCSTTFYIRDLEHCAFWYLLGVLEPIPHIYQGTVFKFWGSQQLCGDLRLRRSRHPESPPCSRVN